MNRRFVAAPLSLVAVARLSRLCAEPVPVDHQFVHHLPVIHQAERLLNGSILLARLVVAIARQEGGQERAGLLGRFRILHGPWRNQFRCRK